MPEQPAIPTQILAQKLVDRRFPFVIGTPEVREQEIFFQIANPVQEESPFFGGFICAGNLITLVIPRIAKAEPQSLELCVVGHSNFEHRLGRWGWDPKDGQVLFVSEVPVLGGVASVGQVVDDFLNLVPRMLIGFYLGYLRLIANTNTKIPHQLIEMLICSALEKLTKLGILKDEASPAAPPAEPSNAKPSDMPDEI